MQKENPRSIRRLPPLRAASVLLLTAYTGFIAPARGTPSPQAAKAQRKLFPIGNYDIRFHGRADLLRLVEERFPGGGRELARRASDRRRSMQTALGRLLLRLPQLQVQYSPLTGSAEVVRSGRGALASDKRNRPATELALDFLRQHAEVYGLTVQQAAELRSRGESLSRRSGLRMVRVEQLAGGLPVFQSETRVLLDREGRVVRTVGRLVPGIPDSPPPTGRLISAEDALNAAMASVGLELDTRKMRRRNTSPDGRATEVLSGDPRLHGSVTSRLVQFPLAPGFVAPAWSQVTFLEGPEDWYTLVDARSGILLYRKNIQYSASTQPARFSVYTQVNHAPADNPAPASPSSPAPGSGTQFSEIARTIESMLAVQGIAASPDGWIPDGGNTTTGNNVDAYLDRDGDDSPDLGTLDSDGRPIGNPDAQGRNRDFLGAAPRNYGYSPAPLGGNPDAGDNPSLAGYQRGVVTDLFYLSNHFHDRLYELGFDEAAGNFQATNFGNGGTENDPVWAEAQQGADAFSGNNANFSVGPDGNPGIMRMFLWTSPVPQRDGGLDAEIVLHELTHGLSNRLIGDAAGLNWIPGGGMGEGWSDFYALSLLNARPSDDPDGRYALGAYATYGLSTGSATFHDNYVYGIRRFPYSTDNSINPLTWADVDDTTASLSGGIAPSPLGFESNGAAEVHNIGEIWALTLWEVRSRIISASGGDVAAGNEIMLQLVTDALKMTPIDPSFTQARDALLDADCATSSCANEEAIWNGFADRGLGYEAEASLGHAAHVGVRESSSLPFLDVAGVTVDDTAGDGNGFIDPGETVSITVQLFNPWRRASKGVGSASALLSSITPGITISDPLSTYPPIPAQGSAGGDSFTFTVGTAACGRSLAFSLATTSSLGTFSVPLILRVGREAGAGAPRPFTRTISGGLSIPENSPRGVTDTFNIAEDLQIADLDFRVDSLTHTAVGDLTLELKGPNGFGTDLIYRPGVACIPLLGCFLGQNAGNDFVNTRLDDGATEDLLLADETAAPFTGSWFPVFNSPAWDTPDPVGQLSHFNGLSTQGAWRVFVADNEIFDTGSLNSYSLLVTPATFRCCESSPDPDADNLGASCDNCPSLYNSAQTDTDGDSAGDVCDCAPLSPGSFAPPVEITGVTFSADGMTLIWNSAVPGAGSGTVHDIVRGNLNDLPIGTGGSEICLASGASNTTAVDPEVPPLGTGFWYAVRGRNGCGVGTYGNASDGSLRTSAGCFFIAQPDLVVTSLTDPPPSIAVGGSLSVTDNSMNQGAAASPASSTRYYLSSDTVRDGADTLLTGSRQLSGLTPGTSSSGTAMITVPASAPAGWFFLLACADDTAAVAESDETNNCLASAGKVQVTKPDLVETSVSSPPASATPGNSFSVTDSVRNQGSAGSGATTTRYYLSSDTLRDVADTPMTGSRAVPGLAPAATSTGSTIATIPAAALAGTYFLLACADDTLAAAEADETNNCFASAGQVQVTRPDLLESSLTEPPASAPAGSFFSVTDTVLNQGNGSAGTSATRFYLSVDSSKDGSDTLLAGLRAISALSPGVASTGTINVTVPSAIAPGVYLLLACADDTAAVVESNETNNCRASTGHVLVTKPDLVATAVSEPPGAAAAGSGFPVTDTVQNQGTGASGSSTTRYYLSLDGAKDGTDLLLTGGRGVAALAAGTGSTGTVTVTVPSGTPAGSYLLLACADDTGTVNESNETNNCRASVGSIQITAP